MFVFVVHRVPLLRAPAAYGASHRSDADAHIRCHRSTSPCHCYLSHLRVCRRRTQGTRRRVSSRPFQCCVSTLPSLSVGPTFFLSPLESECEFLCTQILKCRSKMRRVRVHPRHTAKKEIHARNHFSSPCLIIYTIGMVHVPDEACIMWLTCASLAGRPYTFAWDGVQRWMQQCLKPMLV